MMKRAIDRIDAYQRAIAKAHLASAGIDIDALNTKPLIAIANSWNEICPGHEPLRMLAAEVKKGIIEAGGEPIEFNTIAMCDGIAQGHSGMRYTLPHREIIADSLEAMIVGEGIFDGVVYMGACDKILPAMLNASVRINLPSIIVTAGPCYAEIKPDQSKKARAQFLAGEITERQLIEETLKYYTGPGVCPFLGTANTMACLCEALGMMLPGSSLIPSSTSMRRFSARSAGKALMDLVEKEITPRQIMTLPAVENAVTVLSAIGGSLNALIHLPALVSELGLDWGWDEIAKITSITPVLTDIVPNGNRTVIDLHQAGGIPALMKELKDYLNGDCMTVTGETVEKNLEAVDKVDRQVIRSVEEPIAKADGIQILYGNLAPQGALVKTSAVPAELRQFTGRAKVFEGEDACYEAYYKGEIVSGDCIVIRYEGPKGGPGMKEMHRVTEIIKKIPGTAIVTDGRFSGASGGLSVGYLCPEAQDGGPIAFVKNGDEITVDLYEGTVSLNISPEEMEERKKGWKPLPPLQGSTYLRRYADAVSSARDGAVLYEKQ